MPPCVGSCGWRSACGRGVGAGRARRVSVPCAHASPRSSGAEGAQWKLAGRGQGQAQGSPRTMVSCPLRSSFSWVSFLFASCSACAGTGGFDISGGGGRRAGCGATGPVPLLSAPLPSGRALLVRTNLQRLGQGEHLLHKLLVADHQHPVLAPHGDDLRPAGAERVRAPSPGEARCRRAGGRGKTAKRAEVAEPRACAAPPVSPGISCWALLGEAGTCERGVVWGCPHDAGQENTTVSGW